MAKVERFEDLKVWQEARKLAQEVFLHILNNDMIRDYKLKDQINGSSGSVMDNIAEGFERGGNREFIQFLAIARASCGEVRSQLYRSLDREYLKKPQFEKLKGMTIEISKMITGLMNYLKKSDYKGLKYKVDEPLSIYEIDQK